MKVIIPILFFTVACVYSASAQTVSSQKSAQIQEVNEPVAPLQASTTATLVSSGRNAVTREVPVENKQETTEPKTEIMSSERKPQ